MERSPHFVLASACASSTPQDDLRSSWRAALAAFIAHEAKPVEKYGHQPRLYELTRVIGHGLSYDDDILYAAAWLHDLGVFIGHRPEGSGALERWDCSAYAQRTAPELLRDMGFPPEKLDAVIECIRTHQPDFDPTNIESTILRDADILEQLGAVGILRTVCKVGRDTRFHTFTDAVASLQTAINRLPPLLRLPKSKAVAAPRVEILKDFLRAVRDEAQDNLH